VERLPGCSRSNTGWGLKWDFIIIHESDHGGFGNNITTKDIADMWVHRAFTTSRKPCLWKTSLA
jgi:aminopeptidase N